MGNAMKRQLNSKSQEHNADSVLRVEEIRQVKLDRITTVRDGEEPSYSYHFRPSVPDVPEDFFVMNDIVWVPYDEDGMPRWMRNYVQSLKEEGQRVEASSATGGILCFRLSFRGERITLWFNAWTSTAVVIGGDGKVRKPLFAEESTNA